MDRCVTLIFLIIWYCFFLSEDRNQRRSWTINFARYTRNSESPRSQLLCCIQTASMEFVSWFDKLLYIKSKHGDIEGVKYALANGGKVSTRSPIGLTPLLVAAQNGHRDICGLLLAAGSDVNEVYPLTQQTALILAAQSGHVEIVQDLLRWGAAIDQQDYTRATSLHAACEQGHLACVLALVKAGASMNLANEDEALPIHVAAGFNRVEVVKALLELGCSPNMVRQ